MASQGVVNGDTLVQYPETTTSKRKIIRFRAHASSLCAYLLLISMKIALAAKTVDWIGYKNVHYSLRFITPNQSDENWFQNSSLIQAYNDFFLSHHIGSKKTLPHHHNEKSRDFKVGLKTTQASQKGPKKMMKNFAQKTGNCPVQGRSWREMGCSLGVQPRQINFACNFCLKFEGTTPTEGDMVIASSLWNDVFHRQFCPYFQPAFVWKLMLRYFSSYNRRNSINII